MNRVHLKQTRKSGFMTRQTKRLFNNEIADIIGRNTSNLNAISRSSGISHTYLTKLVQGKINRPGKDKIVSVLLGLNHSIAAINTILAQYDYLPLDLPDIPAILANNTQRKIDNTTLPLYELIYVRLMLASMEQITGTKILTRHSPSALFMPAALYHGQDHYNERDDAAKPFYRAFSQALFIQRKENFLSWARHKANRFETYICKSCLEAYLEKHLAQSGSPMDTFRQEQVVRYFANAIRFIRQHPKQHLTFICDHCSYFIYQIQGADQKSPKVLYLGKAMHKTGRGPDHMSLQGFVSAHPQVVELFKKETELCRSTAIAGINDNYPNGLLAYLSGLFETRGLGKQLETAVDGLMASGGMY